MTQMNLSNALGIASLNLGTSTLTQQSLQVSPDYQVNGGIFEQVQGDAGTLDAMVAELEGENLVYAPEPSFQGVLTGGVIITTTQLPAPGTSLVEVNNETLSK